MLPTQTLVETPRTRAPAPTNGALVKVALMGLLGVVLAVVGAATTTSVLALGGVVLTVCATVLGLFASFRDVYGA